MLILLPAISVFAINYFIFASSLSHSTALTSPSSSSSIFSSPTTHFLSTAAAFSATTSFLANQQHHHSRPSHFNGFLSRFLDSRQPPVSRAPPVTKTLALRPRYDISIRPLYQIAVRPRYEVVVYQPFDFAAFFAQSRRVEDGWPHMSAISPLSLLLALVAAEWYASSPSEDDIVDSVEPSLPNHDIIEAHAAKMAFWCQPSSAQEFVIAELTEAIIAHLELLIEGPANIADLLPSSDGTSCEVFVKPVEVIFLQPEPPIETPASIVDMLAFEEDVTCPSPITSKLEVDDMSSIPTEAALLHLELPFAFLATIAEALSSEDDNSESPTVEPVEAVFSGLESPTATLSRIVEVLPSFDDNTSHQELEPAEVVSSPPEPTVGTPSNVVDMHLASTYKKRKKQKYRRQKAARKAGITLPVNNSSSLAEPPMASPTGIVEILPTSSSAYKRRKMKKEKYRQRRKAARKAPMALEEVETTDEEEEEEEEVTSPSSSMTLEVEIDDMDLHSVSSMTLADSVEEAVEKKDIPGPSHDDHEPHSVADDDGFTIVVAKRRRQKPHPPCPIPPTKRPRQRGNTEKMGGHIVRVGPVEEFNVVDLKYAAPPIAPPPITTIPGAPSYAMAAH